MPRTAAATTLAAFAERLSLSPRVPRACRAALLRAAQHAHEQRIQNRNTLYSTRA